ncbi:MAG: DEAD/DEAH box helicase family protein, partial [Prevotella sp.]|nr:DEAD/DEAH box helicase family protein [Prevotella sp.]
MNEAQTRFNKIDPKLRDAGWGIVPGSKILVEQSAYIAPGRITSTGHKNPKKADYILEYKGQKLAVIEAKSDEKDVAEGVDQAKLYANALNIRYTYSTNGNEIWFIDMGVKNSKGDYIIPSKEHDIDYFPTPQDLWQMTFPDENPWRDKFNLCALNRSGGRQPRYYQEIAINNVLEAVAKQRNRILLTMATGTGKTYTAFQICWKLTQTKWCTKGVERAPRILFISDRNILANQAINDFDQFPEDAMCRITPKELRKNNYKVPTARNLYFTIFQTMMTSPNAQKAEEQGITLPEGSNDQPYYMQYERNFFDFIIIDECHRGGANDESEWRKLMEYFDSAYQLGMTATPKRNVNANTYAYFGEPVYTYSLKQGIEDGFLVPFRVEISTSNIDDYQYKEGDIVKSGEIDYEKIYSESDFYNGRIQIKERDEHRVEELLNKIDP